MTTAAELSKKIQKVHRMWREFCDVCTVFNLHPEDRDQAYKFSLLVSLPYNHRPADFEDKIDLAIRWFLHVLSHFQVKYVGTRIVSVTKVKKS